MPASSKPITLLARLTKWKLSLAVTFSAVTGYFIGSGQPDHHLTAMCAGVFLLSCGASALNQVTERKSDALMDRTRNRPVASMELRPADAVLIALAMIITGTLFLYYNGLVPALFGILNIILYNVVYTGLKKVTVHAILPGALVGAVPPYIGQASAGGDLADTRIILFAIFMFLWQLPHFWLLLAKYGKEYEKAGIKTLYPRMDIKRINHLVIIWVTSSSAILLTLTLLLLPLTLSAAVAITLLNIIFIFLFRNILLKNENEEPTQRAFLLINVFSLLIMIIIIAAS